MDFKTDLSFFKYDCKNIGSATLIKDDADQGNRAFSGITYQAAESLKFNFLTLKGE